MGRSRLESDEFRSYATWTKHRAIVITITLVVGAVIVFVAALLGG